MLKLIQSLFVGTKSAAPKPHPKKIDEAAKFAELSRQLRERSVPLWPLWVEFMALISGGEDVNIMEASLKKAEQIEDIMIKRQDSGDRFEKLGNYEKAIEIYQQCVADKYDGAGPYERLRIICKAEKKYPEMVAVCRAYLACGHDEKLKAKYLELISKYDTAV